MIKAIVLVAGAVLGVGLIFASQTPRYTDPDPELLRLAVRATVHSWPTPEPREIVVTRVVEVTRIVEVTRGVEPGNEGAENAPGSPEDGTPEPESMGQDHEPSALTSDAGDATSALADEPLALAASAATAPEPTPDPNPVPTESPTTLPTATAVPPEPTPEPTPEPVVEAPPPAVEAAPVAGCPATSDRHYTVIPIEGGPTDHPAHEHGDLNFALRGSQAMDSHLGLVDISGPTDGDAPQLPGIFGDNRTAGFTMLYRVFDWNWGCGGRGCRGDLLGYPEATGASVQTSPGEGLAPARRGPEIYGGGFVALVLYADEHAITLGYTREDSVANGYALHLNQICVDPNLLAAYRGANASGRGSLPGLRNGEVLGTARSGEMFLAIRDRGMFKDPRSRKDWWAGR